MFDGVNEIAIVVTSLLTIAVGSIWYSPLVFGKYWMVVASLTKGDLELPRAALARALAYGFVANAFFMYVIARLIPFAQLNNISLVELDILLVLLLATSMASVVIWEKKSLSYLAIHAGYAALVVGMGTTVLALWPW